MDKVGDYVLEVNRMDKLKVCVIFGGASSEHDVSRVSVKTVLNNIDREKYDVITIGITKDGQWRLYEGDIETISKDNWLDFAKTQAIVSPDREDRAIIVLGETTEKIKIDVAYPVLHGKNGEDGTIQGLFALAGIPCAGGGVIGSAVCMDKCMAKILFEKAGIPQADWVEVKCCDTPDFELMEKKLGYPMFVKPSSAGSSVGVTKASNREELEKGIELALLHDYKVLVEECVNCREIESAVMGNHNPLVSENLGEIMPAKEFYYFDAKYNDENSKTKIPADLPTETVEKIKEYAKKAYKITECRGYSRVDFFVDRDTGEIKLNEINTIPGYTPISMYPKLWMDCGVDIKEQINKHIEYALEESNG